MSSEPTTPAAANHAITARPRASLPVVIICSLLIVGTLYVARDLIIPVVLGLLLALLLMPLLRKLQARKVPDAVSAFVLVACVVLVFALGVLTLAGQAQQWLADTPQLLSKAGQLLPANAGPLQHLREATTALQEITRSEHTAKPVQVEVASQDTLLTVLGVSTHFVGTAVIVFVLAFFLLAFQHSLVNSVLGNGTSFDDKRNIVELIRDIEEGVSRYLFTVTLINLALGATTALILWLMSIPNPVLWGVLVAVANFVPHVGAFFCMAILFIVGAVSHESLMYGLATAGAFAVLTSIESYFVTPLVLSRSLQLSPLAIILSILFWGWLWGIAGGLMAAPLLAMLKITCDEFDSLRPLAQFLAGEHGKNGKPPSVT
jgi:predicted PurR-regulated permease PerM